MVPRTNALSIRPQGLLCFCEPSCLIGYLKLGNHLHLPKQKKVDRFQRLSCIALFAQKVLVTRFTPIWKSCTEQRTQHSPDVQRALPVAVGFAVHARVGVPGAHWERVGSALGEPQGVWVLVWIPMPRTSAGLPRRARGAPDARQERAGGARGGSHLDQHSAHLRWVVASTD